MSRLQDWEGSGLPRFSFRVSFPLGKETPAGAPRGRRGEGPRRGSRAPPAWASAGSRAAPFPPPPAPGPRRAASSGATWRPGPPSRPARLPRPGLTAPRLPGLALLPPRRLSRGCARRRPGRNPYGNGPPPRAGLGGAAAPRRRGWAPVGGPGARVPRVPPRGEEACRTAASSSA